MRQRHIEADISAGGVLVVRLFVMMIFLKKLFHWKTCF